MSFFDVKLTRSHETLKRQLKLGASGATDAHVFEVPVHQDVVVRFEAEPDVFAAEPSAVIALAAAHVRPDPTLPAEGFRPWRAEMLREAYDFEAPRAVHLPAGSPAATLLGQMLGGPAAGHTDAFSAHRVFEHWFCTIGNGLAWRDGCLAYRAAQRATTTGDADEHDREVATDKLHAWARQLLIDPPVMLYPLSPGYSNLFDIPEDVEDSFLMAAMHLCDYLLSRPVWQNFGYSPAELTGRDPLKAAAVWQTDQWRCVALADGMKYRTLVEQGYARLVLGPWGRRLRALGFEDKGFKVDYSLPPRARRYAANQA